MYMYLGGKIRHTILVETCYLWIKSKLSNVSGATVHMCNPVIVSLTAYVYTYLGGKIRHTILFETCYLWIKSKLSNVSGATVHMCNPVIVSLTAYVYTYLGGKIRHTILFEICFCFFFMDVCAIARHTKLNVTATTITCDLCSFPNPHRQGKR